MAFSLSNFYQSCGTSSRGKLEAIQGLSLQQRVDICSFIELSLYFIVLQYKHRKEDCVLVLSNSSAIFPKARNVRIEYICQGFSEAHTDLKPVKFLSELWARSRPWRGGHSDDPLGGNLLFFCSILSHGLTLFLAPWPQQSLWPWISKTNLFCQIIPRVVCSIGRSYRKSKNMMMVPQSSDDLHPDLHLLIYLILLSEMFDLSFSFCFVFYLSLSLSLFGFSICGLGMTNV